jgi:hypothetical protein
MSLAEARLTLDAVRDGVDVPFTAITEALIATGDYVPIQPRGESE